MCQNVIAAVVIALAVCSLFTGHAQASDLLAAGMTAGFSSRMAAN